MTSIIKVNNIQNSSGTAYNFIKQVQQGTHTQTTSGYNTPSANDTWTDIPNITVSITPNSSSSKILILTNAIGYARQNDYVGFRLLRDSTVIYNQWTYIDDPSYWSQASCNIVHLDSPSTTSSITYKVQMWAGNNYGNLRMFHSGDTFSSDNTSGSNGSIVTLEVAG